MTVVSEQMMSERAVVAEQVHKRYGTVEALKGVSLEAQARAVTCLIGPSGSGKSTVLRCINHLERIESGRMVVDGELVGYREVAGKLYELSPREVARRRARIGMVFQRFNLFPHMTAIENVSEAPCRVNMVPRADAQAHAQDLLAMVGLGAKSNRYPSQLSGGEQQRVAIARALAMNPKLLLFDEPTSALDPELVGEVLNVMRGLAERGMTMVIATHEMEFAREVADQIVFMADGAVVENGPPDQILRNPRHERTRLFLARILGDE
jgi:polar amino acid transport system ATP-binding protein